MQVVSAKICRMQNRREGRVLVVRQLQEWSRDARPKKMGSRGTFSPARPASDLKYEHVQILPRAGCV